MNDTMDAESAALLESELAAGTEGKRCKLPGCPGVIPADAPNRREFCDEHSGRAPDARKRRRDWMKEHGGATQDKAPNVVVNLAGGKPNKGKGGAKGGATAEQIAAVQQRALWLAQSTAAVLLMVTKPSPTRDADVGDIAAGAEGWAASVGELAKHEEWLRNLGAGGEMSERAMAWLGFVMASAAMATPILVRHEVIKGNMAELFVNLLGNAEQLATADAV